MIECFEILTDLSVIKQYRGMMHGARHNLTFILKGTATPMAHFGEYGGSSV